MKGIFEYCMPLFGAAGFIHLLNCGNSTSGFVAILIYIGALMFGIYGFFVLLDNHKTVDNLEAENRELREKVERYKADSIKLNIALGLLNEHQKYQYYEEVK